MAEKCKRVGLELAQIIEVTKSLGTGESVNKPSIFFAFSVKFTCKYLLCSM
jgi:hypothetical protein